MSPKGQKQESPIAVMESLLGTDKADPLDNGSAGAGDPEAPKNQGCRSLRLRFQQEISRHNLCILLVGIVIGIVIGVPIGIVTGKGIKRENYKSTTPTLTTTPGPCPPACPDKWTLYNRTCYFASLDTGDYNSAKSFCDKEGATLLQLNNETMEVIKYLRMEKTDLWIGLQRNSEGKWQWENGTLLAGDIKEDNNENHGCASYDGEIRALDCSTSRVWICMKKN
ncbi:hypothetical protein XENTR_v10015209 [Xenopus tropicalis]|uniref:Killer cell lectin-like receptor subfamily G member 1 isoform X2 n=1 Tax=Xenopus tropicalis TaxID=8364 RepID=A0A8J1JM65_XENTR|nr:killer cell lectin-like receptor subfamily G member 1 isoform X2 [Xenopus tropicalis]KAE8605579.1 hypothetical protein XENTR_v10015209 [Xenopus tropicalis]